MDNQKIKDAVDIIEPLIELEVTPIANAMQVLIEVANSVTVTKVRELPEFPKKKYHGEATDSCICPECVRNRTIDECGNLTIVRERLIELDVGEIIKQMGKELIFGHISYNGLENIAKYISSKFGVRLKEGV